MSTLEDVLALNPQDLHTRWNEIDRVVGNLPSRPEQIGAWEKVRDMLDSGGSLKGHPLLRLGVLHLLENDAEKEGVECLELAYNEDQKYTLQVGGRAEERAAYRLLSITKDFFPYLGSKKEHDWESGLPVGENRKILVPVLLTVYDLSTTHALDMPGFTTQHFLRLVKNAGLRRFASENYFCAESLLRMVTLKGQYIDKHNHKYPLGRAIVGLIGGVLEAVWLDRLPSTRVRTLGRLLKGGTQGGCSQGEYKNCLSFKPIVLHEKPHPSWP